MSTDHVRSTINTIMELLSLQKEVSSLDPERWGDYCAHICYSDIITPLEDALQKARKP